MHRCGLSASLVQSRPPSKFHRLVAALFVRAFHEFFGLMVLGFVSEAFSGHPVCFLGVACFAVCSYATALFFDFLPFIIGKAKLAFKGTKLLYVKP